MKTSALLVLIGIVLLGNSPATLIGFIPGAVCIGLAAVVGYEASRTI